MQIIFPLEEYAIDIGGVHVGGFNGEATLELDDPDYDHFVVTAIELDGEVRKTTRTAIGGLRSDPRYCKLVLLPSDTAAPGKFLFKALSEAIYADPYANRAWADAVESEREVA